MARVKMGRTKLKVSHSQRLTSSSGQERELDGTCVISEDVLGWGREDGRGKREEKPR